MKKNSNTTSLAALILPHKKKLAACMLLAVVQLALFIIQNSVLATMFAKWLQASTQDAPFDNFTLLIIAVMALLIVRAVINLLKEYFLQNISLNIRNALRVRLLAVLSKLGPARRHYGSDGALSTKILEQVDSLDGYLSRFYVQQHMAIITPLAIAITVFFYSPVCAIILVLTAPLVPLFMILVGKAAAARGREQHRALAQLGGHFLDLLRGMTTLKRLQATIAAEELVEKSATAYQKKTMSVLRLAFLSAAVLELFASLSIALVAVYLGLGLLGILPWQKGVIPVPYQSALFILLLTPEFYAPLRLLGADYHAKADAQAAMDEISLLLAVEKRAATHGANIVTNSAPEIRAENLSIRGDGARLRLAPLSFVCLAGEKVIIRGASGSGKSSLLQAILGFTPFTGELLINGQQLPQIDIDNWRAQCAYLEQSPPLLSISIAANLRLAAAEASEEELLQALQAVELQDLITQLPQGINTVLGERGKGLSGGQQQRLAIAQLLLRKAQLWLLDEPCEHLDAQTATEIYLLLQRLARDKTVLMVSHDNNAVLTGARCLELQAAS